MIPGLTVEMIVSETMTEFFKRLETRKRIVGRGIVKQGIKKVLLKHIEIN